MLGVGTDHGMLGAAVQGLVNQVMTSAAKEA
jgi:hypothetical protein